MTTEMLLAATSFACVMSFTPGPNNILLTASGVNFGFVRSIPHILGVKFGFVALVAACGLGLGLLFTTYPAAQTALKIVGAGYLLWLAWKVANAGSASGVPAGARPISFLQATAFQWVNPKGVIAALGAVALFVRPDSATTDLLLLLVVFGVCTILAASTWTAFGAALSTLLRNPRYARMFNIAMALLLVASIVPMVWVG
ncbi:MAG: LysE family translocator [Xanthobacteraceae bacterium]